MTEEQVDFLTDAPTKGDLDVRWIHGAPAGRPVHDPPIQVHQYDPHTVILRQSKSVNYEAPFLYLLFGNDRALLLDTGATKDPGAFPLRATVDRLMTEWLAGHPHDGYPLVVAHTHGHGDHVAGDGQFADRPDTTVVTRDLDAVREFFGFTGWPEQIAAFDLGGRVLEVTGSPGHHRAAITIYDPWTGFLLTGDTVCPGRLYVQDFPQFAASLDRMVALAESRPVSHVLGCHIEMTRRPRRDYPLGALYQPDEPPLEMTVAQLADVRAAAAGVAGKKGVHRFDDFIIYNEPGLRDQLRLAGRALAHKLTARLRSRPA
ncbi:MAG TPA: MBL fold metallo-hydrolase [Trebonia sp.]|jgi:glyoxylase-like metal-dependent hydrolase (beta-lactamase superfamily II)|nr:MBL fold metallo-hydrolase [Trebonia sp.]